VSGLRRGGRASARAVCNNQPERWPTQRGTTYSLARPSPEKCNPFFHTKQIGRAFRGKPLSSGPSSASKRQGTHEGCPVFLPACGRGAGVRASLTPVNASTGGRPPASPPRSGRPAS
jgi:hypothetical protein